MHIRNSTTLYFIRHGQTPSNAHGVQQGDKIDDYLDTQGVLQVEKLSGLTKQLELDVLYTSYLHRAEETAAIIFKDLSAQVPLLHDFRLRERDFGSLTGKTESEIQMLLPDWKERERMQTYDYSDFGGESVEQVRERALSAFLDIVQNFNHQNIGLITHGGIIRLALFHFPEIIRLYHAQGPSTDKKDIENTDIYEWKISENVIANVKSLLK